MSNQSYNWQNEFLRSLELGTTSAGLADYFEEIVELMKGVDGSDPKFKELIASHSIEWVLLRYEELLDRLFVSELAVAQAFPSQFTEEKAKLRFRQLMRVFHPDRGAHEQAWLNYRAERLNKAYKDYQSKAIKPMAGEANISDNQTTSSQIKEPHKTRTKSTIKYKPNALRETFGNAEQVQKRIIFGIIFAASILVFLVYLSSSEPSRRGSVNDNNSALNNSNDGSDSETKVVDADSQDTKINKILAEAPWLNDDNEIDAVDVDVDVYQETLTNLGDEANFSSFDTGLPDSKKLHSPLNDSFGKRSIANSQVRSDEIIRSSAQLKANAAVNNSGVNKSASKVNNSIVSQGAINESSLPSTSVNKKNDSKLNASSVSKRVETPSNSAKNSQKNTVSQWTKASEKSCDFDIGENLPIVSKRMKVVVSSNVRRGPNVGCDALSGVARDAEVEILQRVLQKDGQWYKVSLKRFGVPATQGWVYGDLVEALVEKEVQSLPAVAKIAEVKNDVPKPQVNNTVNVRLEEVRGLLDSLTKAYQTGDVALLASLYTSRGRENLIVAQAGLKRYYKWHFGRSYARKIQFNIDSHEFVSPTQIRMKGTAFTSYKFVKNDKSKIRTASAKFTMVRVGNEFKIKSFDWKKI